jgi:hypothetical protein
MSFVCFPKNIKKKFFILIETGLPFSCLRRIMDEIPCLFMSIIIPFVWMKKKHMCMNQYTKTWILSSVLINFDLKQWARNKDNIQFYKTLNFKSMKKYYTSYQPKMIINRTTRPRVSEWERDRGEVRKIH